ncbi:MAG TPA: mucoidy inhibitor MuiA family protein, partial [bacterium]|nr:mucoidy inhibitor MuiA family protein [bacterium]
MQSTATRALAIAASALTISGIARAAVEEGTAKTAASQITEVTVYADRARVTRSAAVDVAPGTAVVAFRKLPGWIDEGSVRVAVSPAEAAQILDVEIERNHLTEPDSDAVKKAEAAVREIEDRIGSLDDEKAVLDAQAKQIDAIRAFSADKLPKDAVAREVKPQEFALVVDYVTEALRKNSAARRDVERKRRDLVPEQAARVKALSELRERAQLEQRTVRVTLKGGEAARHATMKLTYMLPGATWEPTSELRASSDASPVSLASFATVTQTTGEDWEGATLTFSTQRPTETMRLPEVEALLLGAGGGSALASAVAPAEDSFVAAQAAWGSQNAVLTKSKADYAGYFAQQQEVQARVERVFHELQERGTTAHFPALASAPVRTDGHPVRVPIGATTIAATHRILAAPEVSLNAAHTLDLVNGADQPVLPGKVALYLDGAFLGTTETGFVAPGEKFSAFAGVADRVKLARTLDKKRSGLERGGKKTKIQVSWVVSAENL